MKFDQPATKNVIDQLKVVGQPVDRIDGPLKATGTAPYANDRHDVVANQAYGYIVPSAIAKGRIASMDLSAAKAAPGVIAIVTAQNAGKLGKGNFNTALLLGGPNIQHYHQAIALVVAETYEQARAAAHLVRVQYAPVKGAYDLAAMKDNAKPADSFGAAAESEVGDFAGAFAAAPVKLDASYTTAHESHSMMEPHATIAAWDGDQLTLWTANQMIAWSTADMAKTLGIPKEKVRLMSPYIGGGFGGEALDSRRRGAGRSRCACSATAGEGRARARHHAQQYRPPFGHPAAHPHRRREGRQDHRHRPRELVRRTSRAAVRRPRQCKPGRCTRGPTA